MGLFQFLWRLLPDRCQMPHCTRRGVRGNENMVPVGEGERRVWRMMCDECTQIHLIRKKAGVTYAEVLERAIGALNEEVCPTCGGPRGAINTCSNAFHLEQP